MYTTYEEAKQALVNAEADVAADAGEEMVEAGYQDIVESVLWECSREVGRELARRKLGYMPGRLVSQFGELDALDS